ncbi:Dimethylaniline monooxygenase [N-oxide-forming] 2 [Beauveria bassiana]|nr:Dimethylaniline monooxygenase [N-oxide-forming] 2 [Beauveria bassiana]
MKVAIIGGGPSGLVTLKYLCEAHQSLGCEPVEAVLFEYQNDVGGTFLARAYEDAELVSSRQLTCFSDFRHASSKDFLAASEYVEYLRNYCSHFNLWPHIKLSTRVVSVSRGSRRNHVIEYQADGRSLQWGCDAVAICSGLHVEPNVPEISGISHARRVMHSSQSNHASSSMAAGR